MQVVTATDRYTRFILLESEDDERPPWLLRYLARRTGLIPLSETGVARESDVAKAFPIGADLEVAVLEVDPAGRRIRLSVKAILDAKEKDEMREYAERQDAAPAEGFGSLADKLRGALKPREK